MGQDCKPLTYQLNKVSGNFELIVRAQIALPADTPKTYKLPIATKPDVTSDTWYNRKNYLPDIAAPLTATYKPTARSQASKDISFGECALSNGMVVSGRGGFMVDNRTIYGFNIKPGSSTCDIYSAMRVHVLETPTKTSQLEPSWRQAVYNPNDPYGQPQFYRTAGAVIPLGLASATALMMGLSYLNPFLAQDVTDPARNLAQPSDKGVILSPMVVGGIDKQRRALGLTSGDIVDIFLTKSYGLLGPTKLFTLMGITPNTEAKPTEEFCRAAKSECRIQCNDELGQPGLDGRVNQGNPFFNCVNECLKIAGCLP